MKKFLNQVKETNGYKELKVLFQQRVTTDVPVDQVESTLVKIPDALAAIDFGDASNSNTEPVVTIGTPQVEHS